MKKQKIERKRESVILADEIGEYLGALKTSKEGHVQKTMSTAAVKKSLNLLTCWQQVAPPRLLQHTDNVVYSTKSKDTEVLVYVDSAAYAAELSMDKELYRFRMQQETEKELSDIKFLVSRKTALRKRENQIIPKMPKSSGF